MREALPEIRSAGAGVLAVGTAAGWQAAALMAGGEGRPPLGFPCVVDPERALYRALDLGRMRWFEWCSPALVGNYVRAFRRGARQGRVTGDGMQKSGVAIVDVDRTLRWLHRARTVGDYPPVPTVLAALTEPGSPDAPRT